LFRSFGDELGLGSHDTSTVHVLVQVLNLCIHFLGFECLGLFHCRQSR